MISTGGTTMWIKNLIQKDRYKERIGHILFSNEILPVFHGFPAITNKTLHRVLRNIDEQTVIGQELGQFSTKDTVLYLKNRVLTQNGIPVKVKDAQFKTVICDKDFSKDGYRIGEIFSFRGMGYLGNINSDEKVVLVTDQLVIFREIGSDSLHYYTYDELKELKQYGKILIAC
jgi:hypothetical protein